MVADPEEEVLEVGHFQIPPQGVEDHTPEQPDWRCVEAGFKVVVGLEPVLSSAVVKRPPQNVRSRQAVCGRAMVYERVGRVVNGPSLSLQPQT